MRARLWLALAGLIALLAAWYASTPPAPLPADAAATRFSAARAMADVRLVGRAAHPVGSVEHGRVAARLVARMRALGLDPRVAAGRAIKAKPGAAGLTVEGADVRNIVGVLRGDDPRRPAVLLMAHYDSVPSSPGAADDGAGLAAALEIVRALRAGGPGRRDVVLLFSDAEENGLLGARAFFADDPAAGRIGFVVNMDMRGGGGRAIMHETGRDAGGVIDLYRRTAIHPTTDSVAAWVERLIRNSSDFRIAADRGLPGLNYAILDRQFDYHAASSTPERLDPRSLQHLGDQVLAVTRALADASALPPPAPDPAYASVLGLVVIAWPVAVGWLILGVALAAGGVAWRRSGVPVAAGLRGLGAAVHLLLTLSLALTLARVMTAIPFGFTVGRPLLAWWDMYEAALGLLCVGGVLLWWGAVLAGGRRVAIALPPLLAFASMLCGVGGWIGPATAAVAVVLAITAYDRPLSGAAAGVGLFGMVALIAIVVQALAPAAAPGPLGAVLGGGLLSLMATSRTRLALPIVAVGSGLLVAQQVATAHLLLLAVGETIAGVAAPFALFAALALAPLLARALPPRPALAGGGALAALGVVLLLVIRLVDPSSPTRPAISQVIHVTDLTSGRFYRVTSLAEPERWTRGVIGPAGDAALLPVFDHALVARGEPASSPPPRIRLFRRADGRLSLTVAGPPGTRDIRIALAASVPFTAARANGASVPLLRRPGRIDRLTWVGRDATVTLLLTPVAPGRLVARIALLRDGWPADAQPLPPRPRDVMPWYDSDDRIFLINKVISW